MNDRDIRSVRKIIDYIDDVINYCDGLSKSEFFEDEKTVNACAFCVMQIGEIIRDISDNFINSHSNIPWHSIRGMRNRIVHDYDNIDLTILWNTINDSLPELKNDFMKILD